MANTVGYDFFMRYRRTADERPIVYFKPRNDIHNVKWDFRYFYESPANADPLRMINEYVMDLSVTKKKEQVSAATNASVTELIDFFAELENTSRGADSQETPAPSGSQSSVSVTERTVEAIKPVLEDLFTDQLEDLAQLQMTTLGNPLARQGMAIQVSNADRRTEGIWNAIRVVHSFSFDNPIYETLWTLTKNSITSDNKSVQANKEQKLLDFFGEIEKKETE